MSNVVYKVKTHETLQTVASNHGITVIELLRLNPKLLRQTHIINPGQELIVPGASELHTISKLIFNGRELIVYSSDDEESAKYSAISGLPANAPHLKKLIKEGRTELNATNDYTRPAHQQVRGAGPIPKGTYTLELKAKMPFDRVGTEDGRGWGDGGWRLQESILGRLDNYFGGRRGFFLHHDGGSAGTAGCIGIKKGRDLRSLQGLLIKAHSVGQSDVEIMVEY